MSQEPDSQYKSTSPRRPDAALERGIVDLYARRMSAVGMMEAMRRDDEMARSIVTQPFGRAFTAQPSFPPDPNLNAESAPGGLAGLRRRLTGSTPPTRKLATS